MTYTNFVLGGNGNGKSQIKAKYDKNDKASS